MPGFAAGPRFAYGLAFKPSAEGRDLAEADSPHGRRPRALVFDSGLGGLSVLREIGRLRPDVEIVYVADDAAFPYGRLSEGELIARVEAVMARLVPAHAPDIVVLACSTASTLALPRLRGAYPALPFVGVVPAVKPAARASRSGMISVLATRGTVARDYTRALVREHAANCEVTLVGSAELAPIAERRMRGEAVDDGEIFRELAPCFVEKDGRRTDCIVLACTHFPLLIDALVRLSPWAVAFVDPAPAIARRLAALLGPAQFASRVPGTLAFTSGAAPSADLQKALLRYGLTYTPSAAISLAMA
ncbi:MAG: glutamate racemase [Hyphomicrobiales bacterium]|nr:glutamate racemase [Hyphomicrobiales bacterium]